MQTSIALRTNLLEWQAAAVEKLMPIRVGALYMDMGTGKTRTALEMAARRLSADKIDKVLWLCPCSVKRTIRDDLAKHADGYEDIIVIHGIESLSSSLRLYSEILEYCRNNRVMLVVDESNLVKNHEAIRSKRITDIAAICPYRLLLNGTPVSKNEKDLFSQWYILDWRILGYKSFWSFAANHLEYDKEHPGRVRRTLHVDYLVEKISPYTYQVSKEECFALPRKAYKECAYFIGHEESEHYDSVAEQLMFGVDELKPETIYRLFSALQTIVSGRIVDAGGKHLRTYPRYLEPAENPRIKCLLELLVDIGNEKVIIFAKYTHEILSIVDVLQSNGCTAAAFYGDIPPKLRQESLSMFAGETQYLVCNKSCAGYGLNLQFCHNMVFYSNDWDYATRIQAEDRIHRFGQTAAVRIYDIMASHTIDRKIVQCLLRKEGLVNTIKNDLHKANDRRAIISDWIHGGCRNNKLNEEVKKCGESLYEY